MGSVLSSIPSVDKPAFSVIITLVSGGIFYFANSLGDATTKTLHLGAFSTWLGTQFWVTFVAGVVMFNTLPRQMFGLVQSKLFPKYFMVGVGLSSINLASFLALNPIQMWTGSAKTEAILLGSTLACNICSFLVVEPLTTSQMFKCHRYEKEHGEKGQEVGKPLSEALKDDKEYMALRKKFYQLHGVSSLLNMTSFAASGAYLWSLQKKIQI